MHMKVVLFDIDGTLIWTGGAGQRAMAELASGRGAMRPHVRINFSGRTDRSIIADHIRTCGIEGSSHHFDAFRARFLAILPRFLASCDGHVLPGVHEVLTRLGASDGIRVGLLTGNLQEAARIKLAHYDLAHHFFPDTEEAPIGAFGDAHFDRDEVARDAMRCVWGRLDPSIGPTDVWIVGDTPLDVQCARAVGARVMAVATGNHSLAELQDADPDLAVENLTEVHAWWAELGI
jgi:phosphoglycolate phosphatase-like HAD superfamily hydrolase